MATGNIGTGLGGGLTWNVGEILQKFQSLGYQLDKTNTQFVREMAGLLVNNLAQGTRLASRKYKERGRARAGWWPAAIALGRKTVYTKHPNYGEGRAIDNSAKKTTPSVMIENSVSYIGTIKGARATFRAGIGSIERLMLFRLEYAYKNQINRSGFGSSTAI